MERLETPIRWPRFKRHRFRKPSFDLQERDLKIVRLVADYRLITSEEIRALISGSDQVILRRLQKLYHGGYLDRPRQQTQRGNAKMIYALGQRGGEALDLEGGDRKLGTRDWAEQNRQLTVRYLEHTLMVSRFRTALTLACRHRGNALVEKWRQGQELRDAVVIEHDDHRERIPVCPDAFFVLRLTAEPEGGNRVHVFLEADRGTMTLQRVFTKLKGYWHYWRSGRQEERFGLKNFLVLTVSRTPERSTNLSAVTREVDTPKNRGLRMFLFGSEQTFTHSEPSQVLEPIWLTPANAGKHSLLE